VGQVASEKKKAGAPEADTDKAGEPLDLSGMESTGEAAVAPETEDSKIEDAVRLEDGADTEQDHAEQTDTDESLEDGLLTDPAPEPVLHPEQVVIRKGGFVPMLLGGLAAAVIGFGAARYVLPEGWPWPGAQDDAFEQEVSAKLGAQENALAVLQSEIGKAPDFSPVEAQISELSGAVQGLSSDLGAATARLDGIEARLTDLEKRPITEGASPAAVAAYERELSALQEAMVSQRSEIEKLAAEAARKEANAEITAQEAMKRAALSRIQTALDTGTGFANAAGSLAAAGIALPPELAQAAEKGVATRADLAADFPDAARAALAVARKSDSGGGFGAFLKTQLGARSLEPREGDDADAVLSRAESAVSEGRLSDAMAEIQTLPEDARAQMSDWLARTDARLKALAAAEALAADLN